MDEIAQVSIAAMESALQHLQEANKGLAKILALSLIINAVLIGGALFLLMHFDVSFSDVMIDSHEGAANYNYIGNDGDISNGAD